MPRLRERRRSAQLPPRPDADERYVHTVRDLMFTVGDVRRGARHRCSHSFARESPKVDFRPRRGAFGRGGACTAQYRYISARHVCRMQHLAERLLNEATSTRCSSGPCPVVDVVEMAGAVTKRTSRAAEPVSGAAGDVNDSVAARTLKCASRVHMSISLRHTFFRHLGSG